MRDILRVLDAADWPLTPNEIGHRLGFTTGHRATGPKCNHAGRVMGPAQHVIFSLTALRKRGLVQMVSRPDGLSGTAYRISEDGRAHERCKRLYAGDYTVEDYTAKQEYVAKQRKK